MKILNIEVKYIAIISSLYFLTSWILYIEVEFIQVMLNASRVLLLWQFCVASAAVELHNPRDRNRTIEFW